MTVEEIFLFHKTGYPLSWIKHALQQCDGDKDKAYMYLKEKYQYMIVNGKKVKINGEIDLAIKNLLK